MSFANFLGPDDVKRLTDAGWRMSDATFETTSFLALYEDIDGNIVFTELVDQDRRRRIDQGSTWLLETLLEPERILHCTVEQARRVMLLGWQAMRRPGEPLRLGLRPEETLLEAPEWEVNVTPVRRHLVRKPHSLLFISSAVAIGQCRLPYERLVDTRPFYPPEHGLQWQPRRYEMSWLICATGRPRTRDEVASSH